MPNPMMRKLFVQCTSNSGTAYAGAFVDNSTPISLEIGMHYSFLADVTNTGAVTLAPGSIAATPVRRFSGGTVAELTAGEISAGQIVETIWDGTQLQAISRSGATTASIANQQNTFVPGQDFTGDTNTNPAKMITFTIAASAAQTIAPGVTIKTSALSGYNGQLAMAFMTPASATATNPNYGIGLIIKDSVLGFAFWSSGGQPLGSESWNQNWYFSGSSVTFLGQVNFNGGAGVAVNATGGLSVPNGTSIGKLLQTNTTLLFSKIYSGTPTGTTTTGTALPAASVTFVGQQAYVSDAPASPTLGATYSGGGGTCGRVVTCSYNGSAYNWIY